MGRALPPEDNDRPIMSESVVQKQTGLQGLSTAILLPSVSLFGEPAGLYTDDVGPLTCVVGIGLFQRAVLTLQRAGIRQLMVLVGPEESQLRQALAKGPRVTIPVRWMPIREFPLDDPRTWEALAAEVRGFCLVSGVGTVLSRSLIEELRREVRTGQVIVAGPVKSGGRGSEIAVQTWKSVQSGGIADFIVMPASDLSAAGQLAAECDMAPIGRWLE